MLSSKSFFSTVHSFCTLSMEKIQYHLCKIAKWSLKKSLINLMWKPMHPLCILHWNTQLIISLLTMSNFPQIILVSEIVIACSLPQISMVHGNCSVYDDYSLLHEVRTFHFLKNVSRLFPSFSFPALTSCISTRPSFWFTFYFRAAALQAVFHVHSTKYVFWALYFDSVFFPTLGLKWIFWKSNDSEKLQSSMSTFGCQTHLAL